MIGIATHDYESSSTEPRELRAPARANEPQLAARAALVVGRAKRHACGSPPWCDAIGDEPEPRATPRVVRRSAARPWGSQDAAHGARRRVARAAHGQPRRAPRAPSPAPGPRP